MRFHILLFILFIRSTSLFSQANLEITNYGPEVYRGGEVVYDVVMDEEGILYFATDKGLLVYDGERWQPIPGDSLSDIRSLAYDAKSDRVYVEDTRTFGYFKKSKTHRYEYVDLYSHTKRKYPYSLGWQVLVLKDRVIFQSNEGMFTYANDSISFLKVKQSYVFDVGNRIYVSQVRGKLFEWKGDSLFTIWDQSSAQGEGLFEVISLDEFQPMLIYPYSGSFFLKTQTNTITPNRSPLTSLIKKYNYYYGTMVSDSLLAIATWRDGLILTDLKGNILKQWTTDDGLMHNGIYKMLLDGFGKLWLANEYGISTIDLTPYLPKRHTTNANPRVKVTCLISNYDDMQYTTSLMDTLRFNRRPEQLKINFATPGLPLNLANPYSYKLTGYDTAWIHTHGETYAIYKDLPNGSYEFEVKTVIDNAELQSGTVLIIVDEPWYMFFTGLLGYFLLIFAGLALVVFLIVLRSRHTRKVLTALVNKKTMEIESQRQELIRMNKSLSESNEELDTFLYRSSHDLVSPVKSIKGLINLLRISKDNPDEYIQMLEERIDRLERILIEINGYVKQSKSKITNELFNINEVISEAWKELEFMDEAKKINFTLNIPNPLQVVSDKDAWRAIISNLLSNAIKYHDQNKPSPFITVSAWNKNGVLTLQVSDNGQGIADELQGRLFEMFYRAHEVSTGSGLGLFLVKKMVTKLNGDITLQSKPSEGTTVQVIVKLEARDALLVLADKEMIG